MEDISRYLQINDIHDCTITGISIIDKEKICISVYDEQGKTKEGDFVFHNVTECRFNNFKLGNIILDIAVYNEEDINIIDEKLCFIFDIKVSDLHKTWIKNIKNDIISRKSILVDFSTSYGVFGIILCNTVIFNTEIPTN
jgi:hypothetical protein